MRAGNGPSRILVSVLSCAAFLVAALAPCPPPAGARHASLAEHPPGCEMHESSASVTPVCPCGCGERVPAAGASARLGVALPSSARGFELVFAAAHSLLAAPLCEDSFIPPIDHVPLPA